MIWPSQRVGRWAGRPAVADAAVRGGSHFVADLPQEVLAPANIQMGNCNKMAAELGVRPTGRQAALSIRLSPGLRATFTGDNHAPLCMSARCFGLAHGGHRYLRSGPSRGR